ncbi:MAG: DNA polymerase III subunit delta' [SAR324 cluster bacterium]|nr:DNA polymerase III subunit delta' [SAR324 cluster bacterium]MBL7035228.1 DNA polymerase III subunit delta' [SAR324 cluster bacterium]
MPFRDIYGQEDALDLLKQAVDRDRMPHAWLFTGQANIGKFKTAVALAQKLNCRTEAEDACGECDFCLQIAAQNFPDYQVLVPDGKFIKIDQIRKSLSWLSLHPDQAKKRVMILDGAQHLGREAANAFLKTLEEPAPQTLLILIAESTHQLLETIVSRCQQIRFRPLSGEISERIFRQSTELSHENIQLLTAFSMGGVSGDLAARLELMQTVQKTAIGWLTTFSAETLEEMLRTCETWGKSKHEEWRLLLDFLETWFRDLGWIYNALPEDKLINRTGTAQESRLKALKNGAQFFNHQQIYEIFNQIEESRTAIELNANKSLAVESLCLNIYRLAG